MFFIFLEKKYQNFILIICNLKKCNYICLMPRFSSQKNEELMIMKLVKYKNWSGGSFK